MARIRSIKPEAFTSESLAKIDYFGRWTFAGLWTYLDDFGYGRADVRLIRAALFPLDDDATVGKVGKALDALDLEGCICRYSVEQREYMHAPKWVDHQKVSHPTKTKFPPCPEHDGGTEGHLTGSFRPIPENSGEIREDSGEILQGKEQGTGNREQGKEGANAPGAGGFPDFWETYPRKASKADAQRAWAKAIKKTQPTEIMGGLRAHLPSLRSSEAKFIPHPATWLNGERWADEPDVNAPDPSEAMWANANQPRSAS